MLIGRPGSKKSEAAQKAMRLMNLLSSPSASSESLDTSKTTNDPSRRLTTSDTTVAKLGEILRDHPMGLLVFRDELSGWLKGLNKKGNEGDLEFYLEGWNGMNDYTFDRISRGTIHIKNMCLSVLGTIQPRPLYYLIKGDTKSSMVDNGFLARFQFMIWPDMPTDWRNLDSIPNAAASARVLDTFRKLLEIHKTSSSPEAPHLCLKFSKEGQDKFYQWQEKNELRIRSGSLSYEMGNHLMKYSKLIPALALIFHLVEDTSESNISEKSVDFALWWASYLETHANRVYTCADSSSSYELAQKLLLHPHLKKFTKRDIEQKDWANLKGASLQKSLEGLEWAGWISSQKSESGIPGRPTINYTVNPKVYLNNQLSTEVTATKTALEY